MHDSVAYQAEGGGARFVEGAIRVRHDALSRSILFTTYRGTCPGKVIRGESTTGHRGGVRDWVKSKHATSLLIRMKYMSTRGSMVIGRSPPLRHSCTTQDAQHVCEQLVTPGFALTHGVFCPFGLTVYENVVGPLVRRKYSSRHQSIAKRIHPGWQRLWLEILTRLPAPTLQSPRSKRHPLVGIGSVSGIACFWLVCARVQLGENSFSLRLRNKIGRIEYRRGESNTKLWASGSGEGTVA